MLKKLFVCGACLFIVLFSGCQRQIEEEYLDYEKPLPPGALALRKLVDPADIPDMSLACCDLVNLRISVGHSLTYMAKPSSRQFFPYGTISHGHATASLQAFGDLIDSGLVGRKLNNAILEKFDVYISVGCDNRGTVLFTGYYTPIFDGAMERSERFKYPLYSMPDDLVKGPNGEILGRKLAGGQVTRYPARAELEASGELAGTELIWLGDPFEVYVAHVQGSAKVRLPDGTLVTVGYAANNGHEYKSVSKQMLSDSAIPADQLSLKSMIEYFQRHPEQVSSYVSRNPRFVFFQMSDGDPRGSLNAPVTPMRSIATDKSVYPRASVVYMSTKLPRDLGGSIIHREYTGFTLDQDTGGAIRAPGRCDVYMGVGDRAGQMAGQVYQEGKLYYLFLKPQYYDRQMELLSPSL